ncbi:FAD-dependent oxidoreductase [Rhodococcus pyridinivorans]|uniref:NAD(P)/FAD-dependent oxidoreductase n=1 Tax=Rhodococcus pyridinivorans TaxID=103816 RepID=UPI001E2E0C1C|nr:FAD-dependent oxidoreductase [Rhodococcus pyridinivorans]MCD5422699.1 FAD-dependent oxidoreductase [Rhodococcus pyridinivorans]
MDRPNSIAVIGASAAGIAAATAARRSGFEGKVVVYDEDDNLPYERPPLSKALSKTGQQLKPIISADTYDSLGIELRLGQGVKALDSEKKTLMLTDGSDDRYDRVVLATGVSARRIAVPGAELDHVLHLRNAADALRVTERLMAGGPLVVVGGGFIGLELAAVARSLSIDVTVVELAPLPLHNAVGPDVASLVHRLHVDRGVRFITRTGISAFRGDPAVAEVVLDSGRVIPAQTVVVGVGVVPNDQLARSLGVTSELGVVAHNSGATSHPWLWAAGDVAVRNHPRLRRATRIEHWDTAQRHGEAAGRSIVGDWTEESAVPYVWSDQYDLTYQSFGRREPSDKVVLRDGAEPHNFLAFFIGNEQVHAVVGIGHPREVRAGRSLIEAGAAVPEQALRDADTDLRRLSRSVVQSSSTQN